MGVDHLPPKFKSNMLMNKFEFEFVNDLKSMGMTRQDVADKLGMTMPTLRSKINDPDRFTIADIRKLKQLNFKLNAIEL